MTLADVFLLFLETSNILEFPLSAIKYTPSFFRILFGSNNILLSEISPYIRHLFLILTY